MKLAQALSIRERLMSRIYSSPLTDPVKVRAASLRTYEKLLATGAISENDLNQILDTSVIASREIETKISRTDIHIWNREIIDREIPFRAAGCMNKKWSCPLDFKRSQLWIMEETKQCQVWQALQQNLIKELRSPRGIVIQAIMVMPMYTRMDNGQIAPRELLRYIIGDDRPGNCLFAYLCDVRGELYVDVAPVTVDLPVDTINTSLLTAMLQFQYERLEMEVLGKKKVIEGTGAKKKTYQCTVQRVILRKEVPSETPEKPDVPRQVNWSCRWHVRETTRHYKKPLKDGRTWTTVKSYIKLKDRDDLPLKDESEVIYDVSR